MSMRPRVRRSWDLAQIVRGRGCAAPADGAEAGPRTGAVSGAPAGCEAERAGCRVWSVGPSSPWPEADGDDTPRPAEEAAEPDTEPDVEADTAEPPPPAP